MPKKPSPFKQDVGLRLAQLRIGKEFKKMRDFAKHLGIPEDRYDSWEKGKATIPPEMVGELRARFAITADWLYFGDESALPPQVVRMLRAA